MSTKDQITGHFQNPADAAALKEIDAAIAAGEDPFGDNDDEVGEAAPAANAAGESQDDGEGEGAQPAADQNEGAAGDADAAANTASAAADETKPAATEPTADQLDAVLSQTDAQPLKFTAEAPADYEARIEAQEKLKAEAFKKVMNGTIEEDEYLKVEQETSREIRKLEREMARAETLTQANQQMEAAAQQSALAQVKAEAKKVGLDYNADTKAVNQFNAALDAIAADPDSAGKTYAELYAEANAVVMAVRGLKAAEKPGTPATPATPTQATKPAPRVPPALPVTLRDVPAASTTNTGGGIAEQLAGLSGVEFEAAYAKLTPAQKAAMLDD